MTISAEGKGRGWQGKTKEEGDRGGGRKRWRRERWRNGEVKQYKIQNVYTRKHLLFSQTFRYRSRHLISIGKVTCIFYCKDTSLFKFMFHLAQIWERGQKIIYTVKSDRKPHFWNYTKHNIQAVITHDLKNRYQVLCV